MRGRESRERETGDREREKERGEIGRERDKERVERGSDRESEWERECERGREREG